MKILNLYSGIGGNRKLWDDEHSITAVELNPQIAKIYSDFFPNDTVIIADAHQYLLDHYKEFDFIWSSPPCPTHSRINYSNGGRWKVKYPDMRLYQEIILLQKWFKGIYVVENVISYYEPLIEPQESGRHYFWANFKIPKQKYSLQIGRLNGKDQNKHRDNLLNELENKMRKPTIREVQIPELMELHKMDLSQVSIPNKRQVLRNCVHPELGLHILEYAMNKVRRSETQTQLFDA